MTPEYLQQLADIADPEQLWRLRGMDQMKLPVEKRHQLDAGIALRRYASHIERLDEVAKQRKSLVITPLGHSNATTSKVMDPPPDHAMRLQEWLDRQPS